MKKVSNRLTQKQKRQLKKAVFIYLPRQTQRLVWEKFYHPLWQQFDYFWTQVQADSSLLAKPSHVQSAQRKIDSIKYQWEKSQAIKNEKLTSCDSPDFSSLQYLRELTRIELAYKSLSKAGVELFNQKAEAFIFANFQHSESQYLYACQVLQQFINFQNQRYRLEEDYLAINLAPQKTTPKFNPLQIDEKYVKQGKKFKQIVRLVLTHWETTPTFDLSEIIGWLLFSGIAFGGINEPKMLHAWLINLLTKDFQPYFNHRILTQIRYASKNYGNERLDTEGDNSHHAIFNSQQICLDLVSQCWVVALKKHTLDKKILANLNINQLLISVLEPVLKRAGVAMPTLNQLLRASSYHWERLPNVRINHALAMILQGRQVTTGLPISDFLAINQQNFIHHQSIYDLDELLQLHINPTQAVEPLVIERKKEVRKTDFLLRIRKIITQSKAKVTDSEKLSKREVILIRLSDLLEKVNNQAEKILLAWVIAFVKDSQKTSLESIIKYLFTVGYEWLYFIGDEPVMAWDSDDVDELYEAIIDYKKTKLKNKDVAYSAKLFKRLHEFGVGKFGLPKVEIPESSTIRCVRAEWISPNLYQSILRQIRLSIEPMEADMFLLLFILAYRTGMRKKELLGLRFSDIEAIGTDEPSIVIRPNVFRSTKTQGSVRKIALYAVLTPQELAFFNTFVKDNHFGNPNRYLFTLSSENQPIPSHTPLDLLNKIVGDITPPDVAKRQFTFHAFRHTAISNLALALNADVELAQALTGLDKKQLDTLKTGLLGVQDYHTDTWYAIAGLMGHISPDRSFEYYNHFAMLSATYELSNAALRLPYDVWKNITGLNYREVAKNKPVDLANVRELLFREVLGLRNIDKKYHRTHILPTPLLDYSKEIFSDYQQNATTPTLLTYRPSQIETLLKQLEKSQHSTTLPLHDELCQKISQATLIAKNDIVTLHRNALAIQKIHTQRTRKRKRTKQKRFLRDGDGFSMIEIQFHSERRILGMLLRNATQLRAENLIAWQTFIRVVSERMTTTDSSIAFGKTQIQMAEDFMQIGKRLLPETMWMVASDEPLENNLPETLLTSDCALQQARFKLDPHQTSILLGIAVKVKPEGQAMRWQFSAVLRYFVHLMLLTDDTISPLLPPLDLP